MLGFGLCFFAIIYRPGFALFALAALLPWLNFSPWTGALTFSEFDLLICACSAAVCLRSARASSRTQASPRRGDLPLLALFVMLIAAIGLFRGLIDARAMAADDVSAALEGYTGTTNSWRVSKSLFETLLLLPWLSLELRRSPRAAMCRLGVGMLLGLGVVGLSVLWERSAYPGLTNFSSVYRTVALFWEMHVGGAAIDAYLALATPFVAWALHTARSPWRWAGAALLALLTAYAGLTTFSRGVYGAIVGPLLLLALWLWGQRGDSAARRAFLRKLLVGALVLMVAALIVAASIAWNWAGAALAMGGLGAALLSRRVRTSGWRVISTRTLAVMLVAEVISVAATGSFMTQRMGASDRDFAQRLSHWRDGIRLLHTPAEWLLGLGWGRLPANYARFTSGREFSGDAALIDIGEGQAAVRVSGPKSQRLLAGQYGLTQRVSLNPSGGHAASVDVRVKVATDLMLTLCEMHLLYERRCQQVWIRLEPSGGNWQQIELPMQGPALTKGRWFAPRMGVLTISILNAGGAADIRRIHLRSKDGIDLLANGDFSCGLAHWFPVAQDYFVPWHIDNFYLEILIESGLFGLAVFSALIVRALWNLLCGPARHEVISPFLAASICGALLVGLVSSIIDMPRVAFLLWLLVFLALMLGDRHQHAQESTP